jgi:hypothetical protein
MPTADAGLAAGAAVALVAGMIACGSTGRGPRRRRGPGAASLAALLGCVFVACWLAGVAGGLLVLLAASVFCRRAGRRRARWRCAALQLAAVALLAITAAPLPR